MHKLPATLNLVPYLVSVVAVQASHADLKRDQAAAAANRAGGQERAAAADKDAATAGDREADLLSHISFNNFTQSDADGASLHRDDEDDIMDVSAFDEYDDDDEDDLDDFNSFGTDEDGFEYGASDAFFEAIMNALNKYDD